MWGILNKELTFSGFKINSLSDNPILCPFFFFFYETMLKKISGVLIFTSAIHMNIHLAVMCVFSFRGNNQTAITLYSTNSLSYKPATCVLFTVNEVYKSNVEYEDEILMGHFYYARAI